MSKYLKIKKAIMITAIISFAIGIPLQVFGDHIDTYLRESKVWNPDTYEYDIPSWVRHLAFWWGTGDMSDSDYFATLQYLIDHGYIKIHKLP